MSLRGSYFFENLNLNILINMVLTKKNLCNSTRGRVLSLLWPSLSFLQRGGKYDGWTEAQYFQECDIYNPLGDESALRSLRPFSIQL